MGVVAVAVVLVPVLMGAKAIAQIARDGAALVRHVVLLEALIHRQVHERVVARELLLVVRVEHAAVLRGVLLRVQVHLEAVEQALPRLRGRRPPGRVLAPHIPHDSGVALGAVLGHRRALVALGDGVVEVKLRVLLEELLAGPDLPKRHAQRVDVHGLGIVLRAVDELRRHVAHRAHDGHFPRLAGAQRREQRRLAEVPELHEEVVRHEEVLRLQVAVDDGGPLVVQVLHGGRRVDGRAEAPPHRPVIALLQAGLEVAPAAELEDHGDLRRAYAHAVEIDDVVVTQRL
mmetsp:Transcript_6239/g.17445  ORF Transcript_6239/g.17445 Transcript_6239/m.17445 type:complete len:288 (-) Transcript_6239:1214-2077(-)